MAPSRTCYGASPQATIDPIVIAARTVLALQTIVAREKDPQDPGVVTVGSTHGGNKHNIIPDEVKLRITVRRRAGRLQGEAAPLAERRPATQALSLRAESAKRLARFVGYFNSNLAREVSRLTGWTGKIWDRRYQAILISGEEEVQVARFLYVLGHGVKENLVAQLRQWPGLQSVRQLADGEPLAGTWFDRTQAYLARRKGEEIDRCRYAIPETVTFSPLPCWEHLSPEAYRQRVTNMATEIEEGAAAARKQTGTEPFGVAAILAQDPTSRPKRLKKSPAPLFHAASHAMRHYFYEGFSWFVAAYRTAAEKLQKGDPAPRFPLGSFPPALPFVGG